MNDHQLLRPARFIVTLLAGVVFCGPLAAQDAAPARLIAHWPLDGNGADAVGGFDGVFAAREGNAPPSAAEGKVGQALQFGGPAAVEIPIDLDPVNQPVVTMTFWIKWLSARPAPREITILSTGGGHGPNVRMSKGILRVVAGNRMVIAKRALTPDEWHFVSVTWDHPNGAVTFVQDNARARYEIGYQARAEQARYLSPRDPDAGLGNIARKRYLWLGAQDGINLRQGADGVLIDDLRLYAGEPTLEQLAGLSDGLSSGRLGAGRQVTGLDFLPAVQMDPARIPSDQIEPRPLPGVELERPPN